MLRFHILSLFPDLFTSFLQQGLMERALQAGLVHIDIVDPRTFTLDRHRHVDDRPYGGGPGMVLQMDPLVRALRSLPSPGRMLAMAPNGRPATQLLVRELAQESDITLVCGRYEGFDARLYDLFPLEPVCVGDIVLNGGEVAALALIEAISRLVPGFMGKEASGEEESFSGDLLEYPHYTRPEVYEGHTVPKVLLDGNHKEIALWRRQQSLATTCMRRPDLLDAAALSLEDARYLARMRKEAVQDPQAPQGGQARQETGSLAGNIHLVLADNGQDKDARFGKKIFAPLPAKQGQDAGEAARAMQSVQSVLELGQYFGLGGIFWAGQGAEQSSLPEGVEVVPDVATACARIAGKAGVRPLVLGLSGWPRKGACPGAAEIRRRAQEAPLVLVAGTMGCLGKQLATQCEAIVRPLRPLRFLDSLDEQGRGRQHGQANLPQCATYLTMLLDRVLGDWG